MGRPRREPKAERRSDAHLAALFDQTIAGIAETDLAGCYILVNDRYCEIVGHPRDELLDGLRMQDLTHADDLSRNLEGFSRLVADGTPFTIEKRYVRKDGAIVWVHNSVSAIRDDAGCVTSVLAVAVDISERKRAEEELRSNESRLRSLADITASAIWTASPSGDVLDQSAERWAYLTDVPAEELATEWLAAVHPDDREPGNARWQEGIAAGHPFEFEQRVRQCDRSFKHFIVRAVPVRDEAGCIREWVGADVDITQRKRAEEALRQSEEQYRFIVENTSDGIWAIRLSDPMPIALAEEDQIAWYYDHAVIRECNAELARMYGYASVDDVIGLPLRTVMPPEEPLNIDLLRRFMRGGFRLVDAETREVGADGRELVFLNTMIGIVEDGKLTGEWGTNRDITERTRAEEALRERERFVSGMVNATPGLVYIYELRSGRNLYVNDQLERNFGWTPADLVEMGEGFLFRLIHPDDIPAVGRQAERCADLEDGSVIEQEYRLRRKDGEWRWLRSRDTVFARDEAGAVTQVLGLADDVTERRLAESTLRISEARLRQALSAGRFGTWSFDLLRGVGSGSDRTWEIFGRSRQGAMTTAAWTAAIHADDRETALEAFEQATSGSGLFNLEYRLASPDGAVRWVAVTGAVDRDDSGRPVSLDGVIADITERKRAEEALRRSEERYRTLFESIDQGFCILEMVYGDDGWPNDYRFLEVNPTFERHTGLKGAAGKTARELVPNLEDHWVDIYARVAESGERHRFEQGSAAMGRWFEVEAVRVGREGSRRVALLFSDVTERRRTEASLHEGARQDAFRAALADTLRSLTDPVAIQVEASRLLGEHLGVSRVVFAVAEDDGEHVVVTGDHAVGLASAVGRHRLEEFGAGLAAAIRAGRTSTIDDIAAVGGIGSGERAAFAALGVAACVVVGLVKHGRLAALLAVGHNMPRSWTANETASVEETAERTWVAVERAVAETALRESERRLQSLADAMPQVVWVADPGGTVRYYNSRVASFGAVTESQPGAWDWQPTLHPDDRAATLEAWERSVRDALPYAHEHRILMAEGTYRWHLSRAVPIVGADGRIETWYGTATDVHDLKLAELARRDNEERLRLGIDVAGFALLEVDHAAGVIHLSAEAARLYGLGDTAATVPRADVHATFHPDDRDELVRRIARSPNQRSTQPYTTEYRVVWPSGEVRWLSVRKQVISDGDDATPRTTRSIMAALDITERKQAEADRQALLDALAHDLRNPLTALKIQAQLLLRQFDRGHHPESDVVAERVAGFVDLATRMTGLIDDLEKHADLGIRVMAPDRQPTDLVALVRGSVDELLQSDDSHAIRLESAESELVGSWDPVHVRRVLDNLLGNAAKYSPAGSEVVIRLSRAGRFAVAAVHDDGIGIPAVDLPDIFAFRHRGGNVGAAPGSGVGLAGAKQIVERHGGTLTAQSEEGRGSTFTVRLPLQVSKR